MAALQSGYQGYVYTPASTGESVRAYLSSPTSHLLINVNEQVSLSTTHLLDELMIAGEGWSNGAFIHFQKFDAIERHFETAKEVIRAVRQARATGCYYPPHVRQMLLDYLNSPDTHLFDTEEWSAGGRCPPVQSRQIDALVEVEQTTTFVDNCFPIVAFYDGA